MTFSCTLDKFAKKLDNNSCRLYNFNKMCRKFNTFVHMKFTEKYWGKTIVLDRKRMDLWRVPFNRAPKVQVGMQVTDETLRQKDRGQAYRSFFIVR
ncbi:hypothetical protein TcarDRAFT_2731 [Thermosinus carboxydivorans Nor1]|uniref:Uncharacterized protein n=1 Tax=Thermosinus carboxydivorans Nor1 TaxID=401526 RepID=A1HM67_9FIRM|nr:hypothetical protein TcarDRAFT_2731 [Thermosinus carboxydivorans Nor1]